MTKKLGILERLKLRKILKEIQKTIKSEKEDRRKLIEVILNLKEQITFYEDDECTIETTEEHLESKDAEKLMAIIEEAFEEIKKRG